MSLKKTKQLYHKLVKEGVINKDIQMKAVKELFHDSKKYNAEEDVNKIIKYNEERKN